MVSDVFLRCTLKLITNSLTEVIISNVYPFTVINRLCIGTGNSNAYLCFSNSLPLPNNLLETTPATLRLGMNMLVGLRQGISFQRASLSTYLPVYGI